MCSPAKHTRGGHVVSDHIFAQPRSHPMQTVVTGYPFRIIIDGNVLVGLIAPLCAWSLNPDNDS